jgi:hypothetical protein
MHALLLLTLLAVTPSPNTLLNKSVVGKAMDRDAAAPALIHSGKPSYGVAGAAQTKGGDVALLGANGLVQITGVTKAGTTGDTVTINYLLMTGAAATAVVLTEGVGAGQFDCAGAATDAACVANFCTTFNANASLSGYLYCNYTAATETAAIVAVEGMSPFITSVVASDATNFVLTRGTDGCLQLSGASGPRFIGFQPNTSEINIGLTCGAANAVVNSGTIKATTVLYADGTFVARNTGSIGWSKVSAANQACTTTCTSACVFGQDTATMAITDCADATSDVCICAGAS